MFWNPFVNIGKNLIRKGNNVTLTVQELSDFLEELAPASCAASYDTVGLLIGRRDREVRRILLALDASSAAIERAICEKADLLLTHHPLFFHPVSRLTEEDFIGKRALSLAEHGIALYAAHTNLDAAKGGTIDFACQLLKLEAVEGIAESEEEAPVLRIGKLPEAMSLRAVAGRVQEALQLSEVHFFGDPERPVQRAALCTGSGSSYIPLAIQHKADVLITGDLTYHRIDEALEKGFSLIDASHGETDFLSLLLLKEKLEQLARERGVDLIVEIFREGFPGGVIHNDA